MTSHLESPVQGKDNLVERQNQLKQCFQAVLDANESHTVIFGGDFNILYPTEVGGSVAELHFHALND